MPGMGPDDTIAGLTEAKLDDYQDEKMQHSDDQIALSFYEDDGIHDGLEFPTEEEKQMLPRVSDDIPWSAYRECFQAHTLACR
jgi:POT family proton-dependent oligopeptide transporter